MVDRDSWVSNVGFVLAAVGSAAGLGNIWRFPWLTADNGGSAFLAMYLLLVVGIGVPGLLAEFVLGRRGRQTPIGALRSLIGSRWGTAVGTFNVITTVVMLSFYSVVGGWILRYTLLSPTGAYFAQPQQYFSHASHGLPAVGFHLLFLGIIALIVFFGVSQGIERVSKVMLPAVVVLLGGLAVWTATQPNTATGYAFYLGFDPDYLAANFFSVLGPAAGQALFTLSLGAGAMLTYASYLDDDASLPRDTVVIAISNTAIGVLAGLVVLPLLISQGITPGQGGPGALFVALATAFGALPGGNVVATVFFFTVLLAAVTSGINLLETPVATLVDNYNASRRVATAAVTLLLAATGSGLALAGPAFRFVSGPVVDVMLTLGLLAFLGIVGWVLREEAAAEFRAGAGRLSGLATPWVVAVGWVLPVVVVFSLTTTVASITGVSLTNTTRAAIAVGVAVACRTAVTRTA
ncbi:MULTISPECIES: sodium-dependent transporter [Halobacterium]|uniref:sodium-dependent transporter n=1 Tax=Halobacterium TaxID=2239 RepID=UPI001962FABF|nr:MULTISPECIES: sodium-dependent transporter [Halobacterium]MCF2164938.1 sodium-dependent transporter [Halobacterium salinarum]MCF2168968.1 sodium-dependent transporter [Halobacterium salinarum]MCF2237692.1 sodium-dependent transporter [Halobacterium salinarum]QRY21682.1 sodium-dependent transporter [Halobacterium sp. GSL-19]WJK64879.1 sodium-dependent transporter [Halobacterium salinarum]